MDRNASTLARRHWLKHIDHWSEYLLVLSLLVAALLIFTVTLGQVPLRDWDEGTVAQVAREIWRAEPGSLGWLYPTLHGDPYLNKPLLVHWLMAGLYHLGGVNEWTSRLPGAILTACSAPLLYGIGREVFMRRSPAIIAALVYLTTLPVVRHGRLAMLDGAILCFFLLTLWCLLRSRRDPRWALGVGIGLGLIALTKGIMVILLGAIALAFLLWDAPRLLTSLYLWSGIFLGMTPAGLWYAAQWMHYGDLFLKTHLLTQSLNRVVASVENNAGPPWYYLLELLKYGWPWLLFVPPAFSMAWHSRTLGWAKLVLVWSGIYLAAISIMGTKLPWYILPLYPAIALAVAVPLSQIWQRSSVLSDGERPADFPKVWPVLTGVMAIGAAAGSVYFGFLSDPIEGDLQITLTALALTLAVSTVLLIRRDRQFLVILIWGMYVSLMGLMVSNHWVWELGEDYPVKPVAALVQQHTPPEHTVYTSHPHNRPSLNFYSDRRVLAVSDQRLRQQWQRNPDPHFLLDRAAVRRLKLPQMEVLGTVEDWSLVRRGEGNEEMQEDSGSQESQWVMRPLNQEWN
jgi:4-amino-4-deoxy-L-arabinose transferase-like glycosyltransferase